MNTHRSPSIPESQRPWRLQHKLNDANFMVTISCFPVCSITINNNECRSDQFLVGTRYIC